MKNWIDGALQGEAEAYEQLMTQFRGMALAVAYQKLEDMFLAEDAVQEAFTEAFANLSKLDNPDAFPGWFKVIVERQCYRQIRRKQHATVPVMEIQDLFQEEDQAHNPEEQALKGEVHRLLRESISILPSSMQLAVNYFTFKAIHSRKCQNTSGSTFRRLKNGCMMPGPGSDVHCLWRM
ncbi:RNA polymerase sigma factor [Paenibacillus vandeheii]